MKQNRPIIKEIITCDFSLDKSRQARILFEQIKSIDKLFLFAKNRSLFSDAASFKYTEMEFVTCSVQNGKKATERVMSFKAIERVMREWFLKPNAKTAFFKAVFQFTISLSDAQH